MFKVRVLKPHAKTNGIGVWRRGDIYLENPKAAEDKVRIGMVEYVDSVVRTKEDPDLYRSSQPRVISVPAKVPEQKVLKARSGNWYVFESGEKILGKRAAAELMGVEVDELEAMDVDSDDE